MQCCEQFCKALGTRLCRKEKKITTKKTQPLSKLKV